jgi:hypothetical protein
MIGFFNFTKRYANLEILLQVVYSTAQIQSPEMALSSGVIPGIQLAGK